jgi:AraC-like DNA-binding protein
MDVIAALPPLLLSHLRSVVGRRHTVIAAGDWVTLEYLVRRSPVDLVVLDPVVDGRARNAEVAALMKRHPSLPIILYTTLTAPTMRAVFELSQQGVRDVVLHRFDDAPRRFLEVLERQTDAALSERVIGALRASIDRLPSSLAQAVEQLIRRPDGQATVEQLVTASAMSRRTLYRALGAAGFASPSLVVRGARLLRAYSYLRDPGHSAEDVATKSGYSSRQLFARHVREMFDVRPTDLRRRVTTEQFVRLLARALCPALPDDTSPSASVSDVVAHRS